MNPETHVGTTIVVTLVNVHIMSIGMSKIAELISLNNTDNLLFMKLKM